MNIMTGVAVVSACVLWTTGYADSEAPPLVAAYRLETRETGPNDAPARSLTWELRRASKCVVVSDAERRVTERWDRDEQGRIWYRRIFHEERKVIEYQPADLRLGGMEARWAPIASVIDPAELGELVRDVRTEVFQGQEVAVYRGLRRGVPTEIGWLAAESIPERIVLEGKIGTSTLRLISIEPSAAQVCGRLDFDGYETIDFADIGDRHSDAFLERLMRYEGFGHGHR